MLKKNREMATVIAIEDKITDNEQESLFLKVAGDDKQLLKELNTYMNSNLITQFLGKRKMGMD